MGVWYNNLQPASYKGVGFHVLSVEDRNEKSLAEHARPFVNGADLEDMGTQGRQCQISALYFGIGFDSKMTRLMNTLEESGAGVLVHPIFGRMQNMIASGWSFRTEAEMVNYVALDITFKEATEAQPIFVFENAWLAKLEKILATIDSYTQKLTDYIALITAVKGAVSSIWGGANGTWAALNGVVASVRSLFDLDAAAFPSGGSYSSASYAAGSAALFSSLSAAADTGLSAVAAQSEGVLDARQRYDAVTAAAAEAEALPAGILTGQGDSSSDAVTRRINKITVLQMRPVTLFLSLSVTAVLIRVAVEMIESDSDSDTITAVELVYINNNLRTRIQTQINDLRAVYEAAEAAKSPQAAALYTATQETGELLRNAAAEVNALVLAVINRRPPLRVRQAEFDGIIHQFAHAYYADIGRAEELMRLNPHLNHPSFIRRGDRINYYVR